jgi:hypothetical protein
MTGAVVRGRNLARGSRPLPNKNVSGNGMVYAYAL